VKRLALPDSEINKTHQNPILEFGSSLAHLVFESPVRSGHLLLVALTETETG